MSDNSSSYHLIGKFFTNSTPPSFDETEQSLRKRWVLSGDMTVHMQNDTDTFLFEFRQENDKKKVLANGPFNVNGVLIVIKDPNSSEMIDFTVTHFSLVVMGLPPYLSTDETLPILESLVSDKYPLSRIFHKGNFISFRVEVDLKKPLRPGFYTWDRFVEFKYRNLGDFCYNCGMIGHVSRNCNQVKFPKERALNATSRTHVYGPWLRVSPFEHCFQIVLNISPEKQNSIREYEKTLSYAQFFIELEFNTVAFCDPNKFKAETVSTHSFRFPCSYLDDDTDTTSKAYEVLLKEISENTPFALGDVDVVGWIVENLKLIKKNEFCEEDKWLIIKLQINRIYKLTHVGYETLIAYKRDVDCKRWIKRKISDLIKKRVEGNENLLCLASWKNQIRQVISEMGLPYNLFLYDISNRANQAMMEAVQMSLSASSSTTPADKSRVSELKRFKVLGYDMDLLGPCVICFGEMFLGEEATTLPCSHVYHNSCIERWFQVGHKCPLCGFKLLSRK